MANPENPQRILYQFEGARDNLIDCGVPEDGRGVFFDFAIDKGPVSQTGVWLIGSSIVTRELAAGLGKSGAGWDFQLVDINIKNGDLYRWGASDLGQGGGWKNIFSEDFRSGTTGVLLKQTYSLLSHFASQMILKPQAITIESSSPSLT